MKATEKWPTFFRVEQISDSVLSQAFSVYLIVGVVNPSQLQQVHRELDPRATTEIKIEEGKFVVASLVTKERLEEIRQVFKPRAKSWRGQYYALANEIVSACESALASRKG